MSGRKATATGCVTFRLGQQGFALPLDQVREIAAVGRITPVPLAPLSVKGLANVRGRVVTLIDVATVFGRPLPPVRAAEDRLAVLLGAPYEHLGLYLHAPVEIGQVAAEALLSETIAASPAAAMTAAQTRGAASGLEEGGAPPSLGLAAVSGDVVNLLSARDLVAYCEARVLEGFRRKS